MNKDMMAYCGTYCETCDWKEKTNCMGCKKHAGKVFWGNCEIAKCAIKKNINHCGECEKLPCDELQAAFNDAEHGDNGERLVNLKKWAAGEVSVLKVRKL